MGLYGDGTLSENVCENILILGTHFSYLVLVVDLNFA